MFGYYLVGIGSISRHLIASPTQPPKHPRTHSQRAPRPLTVDAAVLHQPSYSLHHRLRQFPTRYCLNQLLPPAQPVPTAAGLGLFVGNGGDPVGSVVCGSGGGGGAGPWALARGAAGVLQPDAAGAGPLAVAPDLVA